MHLVRWEVLEDLERGDQLEGLIRPRETIEQVGHPDVADSTRGSMIDGEPAHIAPLGFDTPLPEDIDQIAGGTADVERSGHSKVPPQQPARDVRVGGDTIVTGVSRASGTIARGVAALPEVTAPVGVGEACLPSPGDGPAVVRRPGPIPGRTPPSAAGRPSGWWPGGPGPLGCRPRQVSNGLVSAWLRD